MARKTKEGRQEYYRANKDKVAACGRRRREMDPARERARQMKYREANIARYLWQSAKDRAARYGHQFDLEPSDIVIPEVCPVFGTPFILGHPRQAASVDRLIPSRGYVRGNVVVISRLANSIKYTATASEVEKVALWMKTTGIP